MVKGDFFFTLRSRLVAHVVRADGTEEEERHIVLNEVVIDRGANSCLVDLDVTIDGRAQGPGPAPAPARSFSLSTGAWAVLSLTPLEVPFQGAEAEQRRERVARP